MTALVFLKLSSRYDMTMITMITLWSSLPLAGGKEPTKGERGSKDDGDDDDREDDDRDNETMTTVTKTTTMIDDNDDGNKNGNDATTMAKTTTTTMVATTMTSMMATRMRQRRDNDERRSDNQPGRTRGNRNEMAMIGQRQAASLLALHQPFEATIN
jgi:hypothetical protein